MACSRIGIAVSCCLSP